jgi:hypothetical protein
VFDVERKEQNGKVISRMIGGFLCGSRKLSQ